MTIYKHEQRDPINFWGWLRGLFGRPCRSYLRYYVSMDAAMSVMRCQLRSGHRGKHTDGDLKWGYGDNWLD